MRVVDVVARAVGEHRVDEVRLDLGRLRAVAREAARVASGRLVFEVPADAALLDVAVDQQATTRRPGSGSGAPRNATPYSVSMPTIFGTATASVYRRGPSGQLALGERLQVLTGRDPFDLTAALVASSPSFTIVRT